MYKQLRQFRTKVLIALTALVSLLPEFQKKRKFDADQFDLRPVLNRFELSLYPNACW